jgi:RimJ/RimL family protein N-acetyltransferase
MIRFIPYNNLNMILKKNNQIIGKIKGNLINNNYFYMYGLIISEKERGYGYGLELIHNYENYILSKSNINGFKLNCPNFNKKYKLVNYYEKLNYNIDHTNNMYFHDDLTVPMIKYF